MISKDKPVTASKVTEVSAQVPKVAIPVENFFLLHNQASNLPWHRICETRGLKRRTFERALTTATNQLKKRISNYMGLIIEP